MSVSIFGGFTHLIPYFLMPEFGEDYLIMYILFNYLKGIYLLV
jgi:hypothetical protein